MYAIFKNELLQHAKDIYSQHESFAAGALSAEQLSVHQTKQLRDVINYVADHSPFYRKHLKGLTRADIEMLTPDHISMLPFTTKDDLREQGALLASAPLHQSWIYYETTGTTGKPTPCPRNEIDSIHNNTPLIINYRNIFEQHGSEHIVGILGPSELHSTGDTFEDVFRSLGYGVVKMWPRSPVVGIKRVIALINELQLTALVCTPAVAITLARAIKDLGMSPSETSIRLLLTVGELTTPALLRNISEVWNASVYSCMYASQESSILAVCAKDSHLYTVPLNNYYEVIDPIEGKSCDLSGDQATGELVITHLYRGQKPLIRYRTGDMVRSVRMPDGRLRITPIGRVRDVLTLNGVAYCAWDLEAALLDDLHGCLDYAIQIDRDGKQDVLNITVEMFDEGTNTASVLTTVENAMMKKIAGVRVNLVVGKTSAVTSTSAMVSWKAARLHDLRPAADNSDRQSALELIKKGFK
ncbi:phenylacetate--CoA ligase family protein [Serratia rubidaea]|uniref:Phenylacetate--CoA ligase family protein n=1 Tax=Serratia rubidaea TaxID=61652 RepID=A0A448S422_SERRU|nr:AMP-binding protein [Serratia rubidaea]MBH1929766.1 phenylacetate--CoA ligase family protein [Serratia rubidaea]MDC6120923.1 AMP-binding protein [Serratia rubidaea]MEB7586899.1 AMP-binding protein [Serratia rubidaea]VEI62406.1 Phenylacetate-coenzyme A ligase [Serratia rubidaea]